ncbi:DUF424 domain-containing protein [Halosegnis sp.]|uniref:DUF424 domain-containing protein n=1 Tax=Halosegnis sp. TaxID=2864959 RepID=UPI0035D47391
MLLVERDTPEGLLVSVCDDDLLGETFDNGEVSITADPAFYDGDPVDAAAVTDALARCDVANLLGPESVRVAVEAGFVRETNVLDVDGTRHAQYLRL